MLVPCPLPMKTFTRRSNKRADNEALKTRSNSTASAIQEGSNDNADPYAFIDAADGSVDAAADDLCQKAVVNLVQTTPPKRQKLTTSAVVIVEGGAEAALEAKAFKSGQCDPSDPPAAGSAVHNIVISKLAVTKPGQSLKLSAEECATVNLDRAQSKSSQKASRRAASGSTSRSGSSGGKSAGSGHSTGGRAATSGCGKRSRGSSPVPNLPGNANHQQHRAGSITAGTTTLPATVGHSSAPGGLVVPVTLPTPRRRSRLVPAGLLAASAAGAEARPAQTVMEAQERGELVQMQDDARYAMDGLSVGCSIDTQRESAVVLTEMLCSRKGRLALRADGLAQQVLSCLAKLKPAKDGVLGLAATLVLLMLTSEDAHPTYLASVAAAVLMDQLLQSKQSFQDVGASCPSGARLVRMMNSRPLCTIIASTAAADQRDLLLVAMEQATSSQQTSKVAAVERLKSNLRQYGALHRLGKLVALEAATAAAAADTLPAARQLQLMLLVLENATFTCQDNGHSLVNLQVEVCSSSSSDSYGAAALGFAGSVQAGLGKQAFPALLVLLGQQLLAVSQQQDCQQALHGCLSVLMNLSHQNPQGAAVISDAGGLGVAAATIVQLLQPVQHDEGALCKQVLQHLELISVALGLLINLVSGDAANSKRLTAHSYTMASGRLLCGSRDNSQHSTAAALAAAAVACPPETTAGGSSVQLLCTVMATLGRLLQHNRGAEDAANAAPTAGAAADTDMTDVTTSSPERPTAAAAMAAQCAGAGTAFASSSSQVVSAAAAAAPPSNNTWGQDELMSGDSAGQASIVEVYCGMLLGFLVRDCPEVAVTVASSLQDQSLQPIVCAVQRCLSFYVSTGAITEHTRSTLEQLLQHLEAIAVG